MAAEIRFIRFLVSSGNHNEIYSYLKRIFGPHNQDLTAYSIVIR